MKKLVFIAAYLLLTVPCAAEIITVDNNGPADFNTIQAAINDANYGDTIIVSPGTYTGPGNRDIDFLGKPITVQSTNPCDPCVVATTVIDCNGSPNEPHRGFYFHYGEDANSILAGLTITSGYTDEGGGILCDGACPTITKCVITGNSARDYHRGGGIFCLQTSPMITECTIKNNYGGWGGGGISNLYSSPIVTNCIITGNSSESGAGIHNEYSSPTVTNCIFTENSSEYEGGGMKNILSSSPTVTNCIFYRNYAHYYAGGMFLISDSNAIIIGCTFVGNDGGAIHTSDSDPTITNSILWYNYPEMAVYNSNPTVTYSDIRDASWPGPGNINANPRFAGLFLGGLHLLPDSPCINAGDPNYVTEPNETDFDGQPRIMQGRVDMGADEFNPFRFSGDITADGVVDIEDLTIVIDQWLAFPGFPSADIAPFPAGDHNVNFLDFALLAQNWLKDLTE